MRQDGLEDAPQYKVDIDHEKARALGLSLADINATLSATWGSRYVNDFIDQGRIEARVHAGRRASSACSPRTSAAGTCAMQGRDGAVLRVRDRALDVRLAEARALQRLSRRYAIQGAAAPGTSSGEAMDAMEQLAASCRPGIGFEWTGLSYEEQAVGRQAPMLYAMSLLVVFLCLAALYESWSIPVSVMLVVPLGVLGAVLATLLARARERRLLPGRPAHDDRSGGEERDPDRRVREENCRRGQSPSRRRSSGAHAPAPDHHDLARVRARRAAARDRDAARARVRRTRSASP